MKHYLMIILLTLCHPLAAAAVPLHYAGEDLVVGDANCDGLVNITDVTFVINIILGKAETHYSLEAVDVNGDGLVNISDVSEIIHIILGSSVDDPNLSFPITAATTEAPPSEAD